MISILTIKRFPYFIDWRVYLLRPKVNKPLEHGGCARTLDIAFDVQLTRAHSAVLMFAATSFQMSSGMRLAGQGSLSPHVFFADGPWWNKQVCRLSILSILHSMQGSCTEYIFQHFCEIARSQGVLCPEPNDPAQKLTGSVALSKMRRPPNLCKGTPTLLSIVCQVSLHIMSPASTASSSRSESAGLNQQSPAAFR